MSKILHDTNYEISNRLEQIYNLNDFVKTGPRHIVKNFGGTAAKKHHEYFNYIDVHCLQEGNNNIFKIVNNYKYLNNVLCFMKNAEMQKNGVVTPDQIGEFLRGKVETLITQTSKGRSTEAPKPPTREQREIIMNYHSLMFKLQGYDLETEDKHEAEINLTSKKINKVRVSTTLLLIDSVRQICCIPSY